MNKKTNQLAGKAAVLKWCGHLFPHDDGSFKRKFRKSDHITKLGVSDDTLNLWIGEVGAPNKDVHYDHICTALNKLACAPYSSAQVTSNSANRSTTAMRIQLSPAHFKENVSKYEFAEKLGFTWSEVQHVYDTELAIKIQPDRGTYVTESIAQQCLQNSEGIYDIFYLNPYKGHENVVIQSRLRIKHFVSPRIDAHVVTAKIHMRRNWGSENTYNPYDGVIVPRGANLFGYFEEKSHEASRAIRDMTTIIIPDKSDHFGLRAGVISSVTREFSDPTPSQTRRPTFTIYTSPTIMRCRLTNVSSHQRSTVKEYMRGDSITCYTADESILHEPGQGLPIIDIAKILRSKGVVNNQIDYSAIC